MNKRLVLTVSIAGGAIIVFFLSLYLLQRVQYKYPVESWDETINYDTKRVADGNMWEGEETVTQKGQTGTKKLFRYYQEKYVNDKLEGSREEIFPPDKPKETVTKQPVAEIIKYGAKKGYPTDYIWEVGNHAANPFGGTAHLEISISKLVKTADILEISLNVKNLPDSMTFDDSWPIGAYFNVSRSEDNYNSLDVKDISGPDGPNLKPGQSTTMNMKVSGAQENWPKKYNLGFGNTAWDWSNDKVGLDKFWTGTFNRENSAPEITPDLLKEGQLAPGHPSTPR